MEYVALAVQRFRESLESQLKARFEVVSATIWKRAWSFRGDCKTVISFPVKGKKADGSACKSRATVCVELRYDGNTESYLCRILAGGTAKVNFTIFNSETPWDTQFLQRGKELASSVCDAVEMVREGAEATVLSEIEKCVNNSAVFEASVEKMCREMGWMVQHCSARAAVIAPPNGDISYQVTKGEKGKLCLSLYLKDADPRQVSQLLRTHLALVE